MDRLRAHMAIAATMLVLLVGFLVILSPPFTELRTALGMPEHLPGSRFNPEVGAAEIIASEGGEFYLARITFAYHAVFAALLYATVVALAGTKDGSRQAMDLALLGSLLTAGGALAYSYAFADFFSHGLFVGGLAILFASGVVLLLNLPARDLLHLNIKVSGLLLLLGGLIGGYLGSSFMSERHYFLEALITARFNPDMAEENLLWRALTGHEHAMLAISLALVFFLALTRLDLKEGRLTKAALYMGLIGQIFTALASYAVWPVGKMAHLVITPAAMLLLLATTILAFRAEGGHLKYGLVALNLVMWAGIVVPGAVVAMSLRKPIFFNPPFRNPLWDWAELAYNVGHWHILLATWGITIFLIYLKWPRDLLAESRLGRLAAWLAVLGFSSAAIAANFYMLANAPAKYVPNPYSSPWLLWLEPSLGVMALGIAIGYFSFIYHLLKK